MIEFLTRIKGVFMALIKCIECDIEYSDYSDSCPKCGCPTKINIERKVRVELQNNEMSHLPPNELKEKLDVNSSFQSDASCNSLEFNSLETGLGKQSNIDKGLKQRKGIFILVLIVIVVLLGCFSYKYLYEKKVDEEISKLENEQAQKDASTNLKLKRILNSLLDQSKYWSLTVNEWNWWYGQNPSTYKVNYDTFCIVVGVTFEKSTKSIFYLDDSYDDGLFNLNLSNFKLNNLSLFPSTYQSQCFDAYNSYDLGWTDKDFQVQNGDTYFFLAKVNRAQLKEKNLLKYNDLEIVNLMLDE